jgi:hypothetical protein
MTSDYPAPLIGHGGSQMNKMLFLVCIFLLPIGVAMAQSTTKEELMKTLARETCADLKTDLRNKSADELKMALGLPMVAAAGRHQADLERLGFNLSDSQGAEALGREIAYQLASNCPNFTAAMINNASSVSEIAKTASVSQSSQSITGKLAGIVNGDFTYLQIEDSKGKIEKLYWMEYFEGANILAVNPQSRIQKTITVNYVEKEIFNSSLKDYLKVKILTGIQ